MLDHVILRTHDLEATRTFFEPSLGRAVDVRPPFVLHLLPGVLAALLLVLGRAIAMLKPTFLPASADQQTLVVVLYSATFAFGDRPDRKSM